MPDMEKVIKKLECLRDICNAKSNMAIGKGKIAWAGHANAVDDAFTLLKEQNWNVLTEDADGVIHGLPGDDGQYLMTDGKDIWIDDYVDGVTDGIILDSGRDIREITAWMYMPELPKKVRR